MAFYATLTTPPTVVKTASSIASLLGTDLFLKDVLKVENKENIPLFRFTWAPEFGDLTNQLMKTMVPDVQRVLATEMKAKIRRTRGAAIIFLAENWLRTLTDEAILVLPLPIPMDTLKGVLSQMQASEDLKTLLTHLQIPDNASNEATLRLISSVDGKSESIPFVSDSVTVVFEKVHLQVLPPWIPFLMITMSTYSG